MAGPDVLVWLGLVTDSDDRVADVALVLTDGQLAELAASPSLELAGAAPEALAAADAQLVAFVDAHVPQKVQPVLAGRTIQRDRRALRSALPSLDRRLHYRMVDVGTVGELARRWYPEVAAARPAAIAGARALQAARESIEELRFYRSTLFATMTPREP